MIYTTNNQVTEVVQVDNRLDWINEVAEIDDELDQIDEIAGVTNKVYIYRVIGFLWQGISVVEWQITKMEFEIYCLEYWFQDYW